MNTMQSQQVAALFFTLIFSVIAWAVPPAPTSGPYVTDPQNEYVQDATSDAIGGVNMVLCIMNAMNMSGSGMINQGAYVALVDLNKCQSHGGSSSSSSSSSGASAAMNFMTATVNVTRANSTLPMIADVWMSMTDQGKAQDIFVKLTATSSPVDVPPYGVFRLDYLGKTSPGSVEEMRGFIDSRLGNLKYLETGTNSSNIALALTATDTTSGSGTMSVSNPVPGTYDFNYNPANFRRSDGTNPNDRCFDRLKANASRSVWQYGTYNVADGTRVDQANPSFQVTASYGGNSSYGYASYYGIGFQGIDLNTINGANPISGLVVTDQRPGHTSDTFSLSRVRGKLTKWAKVDTTLAALDGIPFTFYGYLTGLTTGNTAATGWGNWQMQWNNTAANFTVIGMQTCGGTGCTLTAMSPVATVTSNAFNSIPISGWSDSFGGNLNIPSTGAPHGGADTLSYFGQSAVIPGSGTAPTALYCLSNCPDTASITAANMGAVGSPFNTATTTQWGSAPSAASTVTYTFDAGGLKEAGMAMTVTSAAYFTNNPNYQWGVQTGRLFDTSFASCTVGAPVCEPGAPAVYYTWSTSTDQWSQSMWLTRTNGASSGAIVTFDPPQNIQYTVPNDAVLYGAAWAGKTIQLQFNGFGNLNGIPGSCVDPVTNATVPCSQNTRYVPAFAIPDGAIMTLGATTLIVKALNSEIRLKDIGVGGVVAACNNATLPLSASLTLPLVSDAHDVSAAPGTFSIGPTKPAVSNSSPKVIDGVVQY